MKRKPSSSEELMHRVQSGEKSALSMLMRRYANSLLTYLHRMTGNHHSSEELLQEVFLAVWVQRKSYEYPRPFRRWLFGIATNKCRSANRSRVRRPTLPGSVDVPSSNAPSPHEAAVATETALVVEQALLRLPEQQREVVVLRVWNGLSYQAISDVLNRSEGTIRSQMHHALNSIRKFLEPRFREEE